MRTWVKICGITNRADAELALELGADALGFVFHRPSPRFVEPERAAAIVRTIGETVETVGVWLDAAAEEIASEVRTAGVGFIQTYSDDAAAMLTGQGHTVIFAADPTAATCAAALRRASARCVLLDVGRETRNVACETLASDFVSLCLRGSLPAIREGLPGVILAGGLTPENVFDRLDAVKVPGIGVDVASGVESAPGRKDRDKMRRFFEEVRRWDATVGLAGSAGDLSPKR